jgi:hypothetical protein
LYNARGGRIGGKEFKEKVASRGLARASKIHSEDRWPSVEPDGKEKLRADAAA